MSENKSISEQNRDAIAELKAKQATHEAVCVERHKSINDKLDRGEKKFDTLDAKIESKFRLALYGYFALIAIIVVEALNLLPID